MKTEASGTKAGTVQVQVVDGERFVEILVEGEYRMSMKMEEAVQLANALYTLARGGK